MLIVRYFFLIAFLFPSSCDVEEFDEDVDEYVNGGYYTSYYREAAKLWRNGSPSCSAVLIDRDHILTAGHCSSATHVSFLGSSLRIPLSLVSKRAPDLAIMELDRPVGITTRSFDSSKSRTGAKVKVVGWGPIPAADHFKFHARSSAICALSMSRHLHG